MQCQINENRKKLIFHNFVKYLRLQTVIIITDIRLRTRQPRQNTQDFRTEIL